MLNKIFKVKEMGSTIKTEIMAGIVTFLAMSYILIVNPNILSATGMDKGALFTSTCLVSMVATACMALIANMPISLSCGMGLNAYFSYVIVLGMGLSWQQALVVILIEGIVFIILSVTKVRDNIISCIPLNLKYAISVGIGFFITFIGMQNSGMIVHNDATLVAFGSLNNPTVYLTLIGLMLTVYLMHKRVQGSILIGILSTYALGVATGNASLPQGIMSMPPSISPIAFKFDFSQVFTVGFMTIVFVCLLVDIFDTSGTVLAISDKMSLIQKDGSIKNGNKIFLADAIGTTIGGCLGVSTCTSFVESCTGVSEGGRTGLTALTTAIMFGLSLFFAPILTCIPSYCVSSALIIVGMMMIQSVSKIDFTDVTNAMPAFLTIILMPLTYSISEGIGMGVISYVVLKFVSKKWDELNVGLWIVAGMFLIKFTM